MVELAPGVDQEARSYIESLLAEAAAEDAFAVVLTGSVARNASRTLWSDVDLYVLDLSVGDPPASVHVLEVDVARFEEQLRSGDDVAQWAARYGRPLFGETQWRSLVQALLPRAPWPDHLVKLRQSRRRLEISRLLLDAGDARSAQKELVYAASHLGRSILFEHHVFPLSRPELPAQLRDVGEDVVADVVEGLALFPIASLDDLAAMWTTVDERGVELSRHSVGADAG